MHAETHRSVRYEADRQRTDQAEEMSLLLSGFCQKARNILTGDDTVIYLFFKLEFSEENNICNNIL